MNVQLKVVIILILPIFKCDTNDNLDDNTNEKGGLDAERFNKDLGDEEWHVAHLGQGSRQCAGDTFQDRVARYRKSLLDDASRIKFVSYDPIPVNISEMLEYNTCKVEETPNFLTKQKGYTNPTQIGKTNLPHTEETTVSEAEDVVVVTVADADNDTANSVAPNVTDATSPIYKKEKYQATTPNIRRKGDNREKNSKSRRGSEYMFSSVEYYDEAPDFDASVCPDAVDVITLEIDELRSYDVECERIVEWQSLIDVA